jgi:purine-nucleoside phosphorylase
MIANGITTVVLTNAAGGIRKDLAPGALMLIEDHLNLTGRSPLVGPTIGGEDSPLGTRFPAMSDAYSKTLRALASKLAKRHKLTLATGVYAGVLGPAYETPAEVRMLRTLGADAVGMSTVLEAIAATHMGARVIGISCITNMAAGLSRTAPNHAEVQDTALAAARRFTTLLSELVVALHAEGKKVNR